jgi:hypothetical protein
MKVAGEEAKNTNGSGRWKNLTGFRADIDHTSIAKKLRAKRPLGNSVLQQLSLEREIRICIRYLTDDDYRLTRISEEVRTRPSNVRNMLAAYGIDIRNRTLIENAA